MTSTVLLAILFAVLMLLLLGAVIFLALLQVKQNAAMATYLTTQHQATVRSMEEQQNLTRDALSESLSETSSRNSASLEALTKALSMMQQQQTTSMSKVAEAAMFGASSSVESAMKLVRDTTTLLGTKDPIAYQQVLGATATPFAPEDSLTPYTSTDGLSQQDALEQEAKVAQVESLLQSMMNFGGANDVDGYPGPEGP